MVISQVLIPIIYVMVITKMKELTGRFISCLVRYWADLLLLFSGSKLTIYGVENIPDDHSYCIVANHQGYFDIPVILRAIPWTVGFVAKKELADMPLVSIWMRAIGVVFMDRSDRRKAMDVMKNASERVKKGQPMVIFPEGTRSKNGTVGTFKQGSLKLATLAKTRILPVTISGTREILEGKKWGINPSHVKLFFHPVVDLASVDQDEIPFLGEQLRTTIVEPLKSHS